MLELRKNPLLGSSQVLDISQLHGSMQDQISMKKAALLARGNLYVQRMKVKTIRQSKQQRDRGEEVYNSVKEIYYPEKYKSMT